MKQRIFNIDNRQDVKDLFDLLPDEINYICKNKSNVYWGFPGDCPNYNLTNGEWQNNRILSDIRLDFILNIDFGDKDWRDCIIQRPINYEDWIGKWGVFADNEKYLKFPIDEAHFGKLLLIEKGKFYFGASATSYPYNFFRPLTQEEKQQIIEN